MYMYLFVSAKVQKLNAQAIKTPTLLFLFTWTKITTVHCPFITTCFHVVSCTIVQWEINIRNEWRQALVCRSSFLGEHFSPFRQSADTQTICVCVFYTNELIILFVFRCVCLIISSPFAINLFSWALNCQTFKRTRTHTHTHTRAHMHTHTHIHSHTHTHAHTCTCTHTRAHTYTHTHTHTRTHTHTHTDTHTTESICVKRFTEPVAVKSRMTNGQ